MRYLSLLLLITSISIFGMHHEKLDVIVFAIDLEIIDGQKNSANNFVSRITDNVNNKEPQTLVYQYHFSKEENKVFLLEIYPNEKEGVLDKKFASLVNRRTCLQIANEIELKKYILIFRPRNKKTIIEDKVIADSCEALIGAIYLDRGLTTVEKIILNLWKKHLEKSVITEIDAKTKLQELSLKKFKKLPIYKLISNTGPRHKPLFKVGVKLFNTKLFISEGRSKKDAEQNAAILCLKNII